MESALPKGFLLLSSVQDARPSVEIKKVMVLKTPPASKPRPDSLPWGE